MLFGETTRILLVFLTGRYKCRKGLPELRLPLTRYVKLRVTHAQGMPDTFSHHRFQRKPLVSDTGKTFPAFPAHATRNFTYLARDPCSVFLIRLCLLQNSPRRHHHNHRQKWRVSSSKGESWEHNAPMLMANVGLVGWVKSTILSR